MGFGRVITDYATFNYLADIFVAESHRGRGLGAWLVECMLATPEPTASTHTVRRGSGG